MAKNNVASETPLNPLAQPYHLKIPQTLRYFTPYYDYYLPYIPHFYHQHSFPNSLPPPPPPPPPPRRPPSSSIVKEKNCQITTPIPCGPRNSYFRFPGRYRRVNNVFHSGSRDRKTKSGEKKPNVNVIGKQALGFEGRRRWKNQSGDYHKTLPLESNTTSVMIKNIPNKYTRELLIKILDDHCKCENQKMINNTDSISAYDHLYLPVDFTSRFNAGFAFVNFTNPKAAMKFRDAFHGKRWPFSESLKVAEVTRAKIQGIKSIINNSKMMDFTCGSGEDLPVLFKPARDGSVRVKSQMLTLGKFLH